ncbi:MAG: carbon-nitrogen hydrolase family protein [Rudaea sp.]|uniref:carbon-nitrogen hydrolase family protein n=1 Tax=unclassified Rudaea TaxID=2627037 RepID=UPI0010F7A1DC|nr:MULTISPECIES: carbon-nitrogen hydrolase family protein [unclassified Rudaea]MBN8887727.1 carbon-nitrogen hydrolase family protein [Rudaea sp.]MBR0346804.1 carbon-nitrogen hydrolase family protein [Rudaea sp.]
MKIALAQWRIEAPASFAEFAARISAEAESAAGQGARIVVLPEYLALELAATLDAATRADFAATLAALQPIHADWLRLFSALAVKHGIHLLAGTFLLAQANGRYRNRAYLFAPDGAHVFQDKLTLTGFENAARVIEPGDALKVFDTPHGRIGIAICYDSEFPLYARAQREAGTRLLLVPSCTDTEAGATRVRIGCMARALENRIYVAQSVTAGQAPDNPALDTNTGRAALYVASDRGLPEDGVVAAAQPGATWLIAEVDLAALEATAGNAQVAVPADWLQQSRPSVARATVEVL